jgi:hypothetical protein
MALLLAAGAPNAGLPKGDEEEPVGAAMVLTLLPNIFPDIPNGQILNLTLNFTTFCWATPSMRYLPGAPNPIVAPVDCPNVLAVPLILPNAGLFPPEV